jgi:hypothetical protein
MRSPTPTEKDRTKEAIEKAKERLYWALVSEQRWEDSRWSGTDPKDDWEKSFYAAIKIVLRILNDPACDSLIYKHAHFPGAREGIIAALERARPQPQKKGKRREYINVFRDQRIAEEVFLTCKDGTFLPDRQKDPKPTSRRSDTGSSIVAEALQQLARDYPKSGLKNLSEGSVRGIWYKHKRAYRHLLPR